MYADHDHRGDYADQRHDHDGDYAERHHRHHDDESAARGLREDLGAAEERIRELEDGIRRLWTPHQQHAGRCVMSDEGWFPEPFGPIYERPPGAPCPDCECCTLRLCQIAAGKDILCSHPSDDPRAVSGCPCSATAVARARTRTMREDDDDEGGMSEYRGWLS